MSLEEQFEKARVEISFRQQFLDQIDLEETSRFVNRVRYNPRQRVNGNKIPLMICGFELKWSMLFGTLSFLLPFKKSNITVYPAAFGDSVQTLNHFLNALIDHEGQHAKDFYFHPLWIFDTQKAESSAYMNEMLQSEKRGLDDSHRVRLACDYSRIYGI